MVHVNYKLLIFHFTDVSRRKKSTGVHDFSNYAYDITAQYTHIPGREET